jgi:hypothetical protein
LQHCDGALLRFRDGRDFTEPSRDLLTAFMPTANALRPSWPGIRAWIESCTALVEDHAGRLSLQSHALAAARAASRARFTHLQHARAMLDQIASAPTPRTRQRTHEK